MCIKNIKVGTLLLALGGLLEVAFEHGEEGLIVLHGHARVLHDEDARLVHAFGHLVHWLNQVVSQLIFALTIYKN